MAKFFIHSLGMKTLFLIAFISTNVLTAQNLVPNGSFEEYTQCPEYFDGVNPISSWLINWYSPNTGSPDYYNACSEIEALNFGADVPANAVGFQNAHSGLAYSGLFTNGDCASQSNKNLYREYLQVELSESLIFDSIYRISFFVSRADSSSCNCNALGILFSESSIITGENTILNQIPQLNNELDLMNSNQNWIEIFFTYIANGNEAFLTIGNFHDNLNSNCSSSGTNSLGGSYYYIDDVTVILQSEVQIDEVQTVDDCQIWMDTHGVITLRSLSPFYNVKIFDLLGRNCFEQNYLNVDNANIVEHFNPGIYFVMVILNNENLVLRKILINQNQTQ